MPEVKRKTEILFLFFHRVVNKTVQSFQYSLLNNGSRCKKTLGLKGKVQRKKKKSASFLAEKHKYG